MPFHEFQRRNVSVGVPSMGIWSMMGRNARDPDGKFEGIGGFIPVIPRTGEAVFEFQRVMGDAMMDLDWPTRRQLIRQVAAATAAGAAAPSAPHTTTMVRPTVSRR